MNKMHFHRTTNSSPAARASTAFAIVAVVSLGLVACAEPAVDESDRHGSTESDVGGAAPGATLVEGDGHIDDGASLTPFDTSNAAIANLDSRLLDAIQDAARGAEAEGITVFVNSGWRSISYQKQLLAEAVTEYGTEDEARRWVSTPQESRHVSGDAVDIGSWDAAAWMDEHGSAWGLCRVFDNEPWHFELLTSPGGECPRLLHDATDPR
ncbi:M15 family metallopeptidase [Paramicrobacterium chengjingii]|uniref:M15 family metallopeptidase n=1 Tax=Paramicrobacterium chengjingii TaxID=2769067 RepID=A0ABX6YGS2_9MICO|nr:M15 family metallopeptidase [Microbacterium chengjingii]QPZ37993.1 M15 family metallopeptidase [Microbacterium chengjingii]